MTVDEAIAVVRGRFPVTEDDKRRTYEIAARTLANACDSRRREIEELRRQIEALKVDNKTLCRIPRGEVWHWQGDGEDHPESLGCPVIMEPDVLRGLLTERIGRAALAERWRFVREHPYLREALGMILVDRFKEVQTAVSIDEAVDKLIEQAKGKP